MSATANQVAAELLDVVPLMMRTIRARMRQQRGADLSVPEFRTLGFLNRHPGASLTGVADHIGLMLPSMSKLIDGLVERKLVTREFDPTDRRRVTLALTGRGRSLLQAAHDSALAYLADVVATLAPEERTSVVQAMHALRPLFSSEREKGMMEARQPDGDS